MKEIFILGKLMKDEGTGGKFDKADQLATYNVTLN